MTEALFQLIWQHSLFRHTDLKTAQGETITILATGKLNKDAGPDFSEARIKISDTILVGNIELHLKSSDWFKHKHQANDAYKNIILHVVYEDDHAEQLPYVPQIELNGRISQNVIDHYNKLMYADASLPCSSQLDRVGAITKEGWLSRLLAERWEEKLTDWAVMLEQSTEDWSNLLYWRLAANFGFKTNSSPFLMLARSIPQTVLARHRGNLMQLEALLFGQAGMLTTNIHEDYPLELQKEYQYLAQKYQLKPIASHLWKFLRMRPANFPTIRIAQYAALVHRSEHLFSRVIEIGEINGMEALLNVTASHYWNNHFRFGEGHENPTPKALGKDSIHNIIINTIAPIQFLYATRQGTDSLKEQALNLLEQVPSEKNNIIKIWNENKWVATSAAQTQSLIQLYNKYCTSKRCLECAVGVSIVRNPS